MASGSNGVEAKTTGTKSDTSLCHEYFVGLSWRALLYSARQNTLTTRHLTIVDQGSRPPSNLAFVIALLGALEKSCQTIASYTDSFFFEASFLTY